MDDGNTRDIAVKADTKIDAHVTDCQQFRLIIDKRLCEFREDLKKLNWRVALITGMGVALSKVIDGAIHLINH